MAREQDGKIQVYDISGDTFRDLTLRDVNAMEAWIHKVAPELKRLDEKLAEEARKIWIKAMS